MTLSEAYISLRAAPAVGDCDPARVSRGRQIGYLGADFDLRGLPITKDLYSEPSRWRQLKGDPAIRGNVFQQCRIQSRLDDQIDMILPVLEELVVENGVFHLKIHFSSSRATIWLLNDPYRYQLLEFDDLVDPDVCLAFPHSAYPDEAIVPKDQDSTDPGHLQTPALRGRDDLSPRRLDQRVQRDRRPEFFLRRFSLHPGRSVSRPRLGILGRHRLRPRRPPAPGFYRRLVRLAGDLGSSEGHRA